MKYSKILLASHGTEGAQAAEQTALELCSESTILHQLIVVPDFWKGMMGDDWLNNARTRETYGRYVESELEKEILEHLDRVKTAAEARGVTFDHIIMVGKPDKCLLELCSRESFDLVVMGSSRPKGKSGLRSRLATEPLSRSLTTPLLIVPYPQDYQLNP